MCMAHRAKGGAQAVTFSTGSSWRCLRAIWTRCRNITSCQKEMTDLLGGVDLEERYSKHIKNCLWTTTHPKCQHYLDIERTPRTINRTIRTIITMRHHDAPSLCKLNVHHESSSRITMMNHHGTSWWCSMTMLHHDDVPWWILMTHPDGSSS